jgi:hypothetical protein
VDGFWNFDISRLTFDVSRLLTTCGSSSLSFQNGQSNFQQVSQLFIPHSEFPQKTRTLPKKDALYLRFLQMISHTPHYTVFNAIVSMIVLS